MADDAYLLSLAQGAAQDLAGVRADVASIAEVILPDESEVSLLADDGASDGAARSVGSLESGDSVPDGFYDDLMQFEYMQTVTGFFVFAALLLNFGALLWLSFSDKWRS